LIHKNDGPDDDVSDPDTSFIWKLL
jgi:hypothetical protein